MLSSRGSGSGALIAPRGEVRLEKIMLSDALLAPQRFAGEMSVFAERDEQGQVLATIQALGQSKQVAVPGQADFYALSNRADLVVMHDRAHEYADTIRIFLFSATGVKERTCGHEPRAAGYLVRLYRNFELVGSAKTIAVTEELSSGSAKPMVRERFALPLD